VERRDKPSVPKRASPVAALIVATASTMCQYECPPLRVLKRKGNLIRSSHSRVITAASTTASRHLIGNASRCSSRARLTHRSQGRVFSRPTESPAGNSAPKWLYSNERK
jgi:hypothetical protein